MSCMYSTELLGAWMDGEAGARTPEVAAHVQSCPACREQVALWRQSAEALRRTVDDALGEVDLLPAVARVCQRIVAMEERSLAARLAVFWHDLWLFHRRALLGAAIAAALGALSAPVVFYVAARLHGRTAQADVAGVDKLQGDTKPAVHRPEAPLPLENRP
jgi:anti-sigma factor RsiW